MDTRNGQLASDDLATMYEEGRRTGLATAALATAAVAFVSLLGIEKATLAALLACLAIRGAKTAAPARRLAAAAMALAGVYAVTYVVVLVLFRDRLAELLRLMQKLG
jgi:hypothetical protein